MLPTSVVDGMTLAALAHAEHCDVLAVDGRLTLADGGAVPPSPALLAEYVRCRPALIGVLGWGVPLRRSRELARAPWSTVQWPTRGVGVVGCWGAS